MNSYDKMKQYLIDKKYSPLLSPRSGIVPLSVYKKAGGFLNKELDYCGNFENMFVKEKGNKLPSVKFFSTFDFNEIITGSHEAQGGFKILSFLSSSKVSGNLSNAKEMQIQSIGIVGKEIEPDLMESFLLHLNPKEEFQENFQKGNYYIVLNVLQVNSVNIKLLKENNQELDVSQEEASKSVSVDANFKLNIKTKNLLSLESKESVTVAIRIANIFYRNGKYSLKPKDGYIPKGVEDFPAEFLIEDGLNLL
jgi:hypothetical protein